MLSAQLPNQVVVAEGAVAVAAMKSLMYMYDVMTRKLSTMTEKEIRVSALLENSARLFIETLTAIEETSSQ